MKSHILSKYSVRSNSIFCKDYVQTLGVTSIETSSIEVSDSDEVAIFERTYETRVRENSDPDEFTAMGPTSITKSVESSDVDEFILKDPTISTYTVENSDIDEFSADSILVFPDIDFDEILLI